MNPTEHILQNFEKVSAIPRGTKYEAGIRQWLMDWAAALNFKSKVDAAGNLVMQVPASKGFESHPTLILQGHMDMVWQKISESTHDFTRDPIRLIRDGDWIHADGTTLGADNGIGIALMMSLAEDEAVHHPPMELLLTVEEEFGIGGAERIDPSLITGKKMVNIDSEKEGVITIGCAGGGSVYITLPLAWETQTANELAFELRVSGLQGGHSGEDIHKHRANANKLMARILDFIQRDIPIRLSNLKGGTARNAIPRDAEAIFVCSDESLLQEKFASIQKKILAEHKQTESALQITLDQKEPPSLRVASRKDTEKAIRLLVSLPNGVAEFSAQTSGAVETSNNIGIVETKDEGLYVISNHRSSVLTRLEEITNRVESLAWLAGAKTERTQMFPPWQPNYDSSLLKKSVEAYKSALEQEPIVTITHGGLECGIISDRCGGLDCISIGATMENLHSPDERLYVPSLEKVWMFLKELLAES